MAILKKSKIGRRLMTIISVVVLLAVAVPLVSAYEAHMVNVKAYVKDRFNLIKTIKLADVDDIAYAEEEMGIIFPNTPNPWLYDPTVPEPPSNNIIPTDNCVVWLVTISFTNSENYSMTQVVVRDRFGAELGGEPLEDVPVDLEVKTHSRGKSKKVKDPFETQYRITWYVTYTGSVPLGENPEDDNWGVMQPGDSESIQLYVWTKLNPAGKQEYTSPGLYTLNSGPNAKWLDEDGHQFSFGGEALAVYIEVVGEEP